MKWQAGVYFFAGGSYPSLTNRPRKKAERLAIAHGDRILTDFCSGHPVWRYVALADGIPTGLDRWRGCGLIGMTPSPLDRLGLEVVPTAGSMAMPTGPEMADVFRRDGEAYGRAHDGHIGRVERRVMSVIELCRTAGLGGHSESRLSCRFIHCA